MCGGHWRARNVSHLACLNAIFIRFGRHVGVTVIYPAYFLPGIPAVNITTTEPWHAQKVWVWENKAVTQRFRCYRRRQI